MKENHTSHHDIHSKNEYNPKMADNQQLKDLAQQSIDQQPNVAQPQPSLVSESETHQTLEKLQAALVAANDKHIRLYAEFENFRKRTINERISLIDTAGEKLLQQLLPILDDFERALVALHQEDVSLQAVGEGVELIHNKMAHFLEQAGVQSMPLEKGSFFNTEFHEAITKTPVIDQALQGKIIDVIEKGYMLKNKVLRYAKVIIGE